MFATRSHDRQNPVSLSLADHLAVRDGILTFRGLEALDGTPMIDVKPYPPALIQSGNVFPAEFGSNEYRDKKMLKKYST